MKLIKQTISAPVRKLSAKWTIDTMSELQIVLPRRKKPETKEEEADEIIHRLKSPPAPYKTLEDALAESLAYAISQELDRQIIDDLQNLNDRQK